MGATSELESLRLLVEHAPAAIAVVDTAMRYRLVSRRWLTDYGLGDRDLIGLSHYDVFPEIPETWRQAHRRALAGEVLRADEDSFVRIDGRVEWVRWELQPWRTTTGQVGGLVLFTEVITDRKVAELAVARQAAVLQAMDDPVVVIDDADRVVEVNRAAAEVFGWEDGHLCGQSVDVLIPPWRRPAAHRVLRRCRAGWTARSVETEAIHRTGTAFPVLLTLSTVDRPGSAGPDVVVVAKDLTLLRQTQDTMFRLTLQLAHGRQMESLATLARGVAHDVNNLLVTIRGSAEQLQTPLAAGSGGQRATARIVRAADRVAGLTEQLLVFSRVHAPQRDVFDLARFVQHNGRSLALAAGPRWRCCCRPGGAARGWCQPTRPRSARSC